MTQGIEKRSAFERCVEVVALHFDLRIDAEQDVVLVDVLDTDDRGGHVVLHRGFKQDLDVFEFGLIAIDAVDHVTADFDLLEAEFFDFVQAEVTSGVLVDDEDDVQTLEQFDRIAEIAHVVVDVTLRDFKSDEAVRQLRLFAEGVERFLEGRVGEEGDVGVDGHPGEAIGLQSALANGGVEVRDVAEQGLRDKRDLAVLRGDFDKFARVEDDVAVSKIRPN